MFYGIIMSYGGIPMIYAGDEIGTTNDYSYLNEEDKRDDNRWLNRPFHNWEASSAVDQEGSIPSTIFQIIKRLISIRRQSPVFADNNPPVLHEPNNSHVFIFERKNNTSGKILVICNFDEKEQVLDSGWIGELGYVKDSKINDLVSGEEKKLTSGLMTLPPYNMLWLLSY